MAAGGGRCRIGVGGDHLRVGGRRVFAFDPGEMDTRMHADAVPDADPATLQRPGAVAERVLGWIEAAARLPPSPRVLAADEPPVAVRP